MGRPPLGDKPMTSAERYAKWAAANKPPRQLKPCGTRAAYERHRKAGEEPCSACVEANRLANAENYERLIKPKRAKANENFKTPSAN